MDLKLLLLMYLEEDEGCVNRLLREQGVGIFSRLSMEGLAQGAASGWYGVSLPFQSRLILALMPVEQADGLLAAVSDCRGVQDPRHPIRAMQLAVERSAACECPAEAVESAAAVEPAEHGHATSPSEAAEDPGRHGRKE